MSKEELKFASENEAMQHLSDLTGKRIKIASESYYSQDRPGGFHIFAKETRSRDISTRDAENFGIKCGEIVNKILDEVKKDFDVNSILYANKKVGYIQVENGKLVVDNYGGFSLSDNSQNEEIKNYLEQKFNLRTQEK